MNNKALFIMPPHVEDYFYWKKSGWSAIRFPPTGILSIASYLHKHEHTVKIIDCRELIYNHRTNNILPIIDEELRLFHPDVVGINIFTAMFEEAAKIVIAIKKNIHRYLWWLADHIQVLSHHKCQLKRSRLYSRRFQKG